MSLSADLIAFAKRIEALEKERDAAIVRAERAEHAEGEALDLVADLRAELGLLRRAEDSNTILTLQEVS